MKKITILLIALMVVSVGVLSGCFGVTQDEDDNEFETSTINLRCNYGVCNLEIGYRAKGNLLIRVYDSENYLLKEERFDSDYSVERMLKVFVGIEPELAQGDYKLLVKDIYTNKKIYEANIPVVIPSDLEMKK